MKVCLVIPVYNEVSQLEWSVRALRARATTWSDFDLEIVIANNGSTDGTTEIAERLARQERHIRHEYLDKKGRGRALRQAWSYSDADIVAYMDVDLSTDISFFPSLINPLLQGKADISVGSRLLRPEWTERGFKREFISRCYNNLLKVTFAPPFSDAQCGFKALSKSTAVKLLPLVHDEAWFFDTELLLIACHFKYRIFDLPVRWKDDSDSRVRIFSTALEDIKGVLRVRKNLRKLHYESHMPSDKERKATQSSARFHSH